MEKSVEKRGSGIDELIENTAQSIREAFNGETLSDEDAIRERIEELRQQ